MAAAVAITDTMLGRMILYCAHQSTSEPFDHQRFYYNAGASNVDVAASIGMLTSRSFTCAATWTNSTGTTQTVSAVHAQNGTGNVPLDYVEYTGLSVAVPDGIGLLCTFTTTFEAGSGDEGLGALCLLAMVEEFSGVVASTAYWYSTHFVFDTATAIPLLGTPYSGGTSSDTSVVWMVPVSAPTSATKLTAIAIYDGVSGALMAQQTGLNVAWAAGVTKTIAISLAATDDTDASNSDVPIG